MDIREKKLETLKKLVAGLDKSDIYRSVYDLDGNLLAEGIEPLQNKLIDDFSQVDFKGKTVIDLGSGFGFFSFLSAKLGAKSVTGIDRVADIVKGANILADLHGYGNVEFTTFNFENPHRDLGKYDLAMLVDFFGKSNIRKQKIKMILQFVKSLSDQELLFAIRPINRIEKDLRMSISQFSKLYPGSYIKDGSFHLLHYLEDILADNWSIQAVSQYSGENYKQKLLFMCNRK